MPDEAAPIVRFERPDQAADGPPSAPNQLMAALWIILLGGRWVVIEWLIAAGILTQERVSLWDNGVLLRCYLVLLVVTLVVLALRAVRSGAAEPAPRTDGTALPLSGSTPKSLAAAPGPEAPARAEKGERRD